MVGDLIYQDLSRLIKDNVHYEALYRIQQIQRKGKFVDKKFQEQDCCPECRHTEDIKVSNKSCCQNAKERWGKCGHWHFIPGTVHTIILPKASSKVFLKIIACDEKKMSYMSTI